MALLWHPFLGANVNGLSGRRFAQRAVPLALFVAAAIVAIGPAFGHTNGMAEGISSDYPHDFAENGCTSCHADGGVHKFAEDKGISWTIANAKGEALHGGRYEKGVTYTITITLDEVNAPNAANHAGFNLQASSGKFEATQKDTHVQANKAGTQVTHKDPKESSWSAQWTAPDSGAVSFVLVVNDVNGDGAPNGGDRVHRAYFGLTDEHGAQLGAASAEAVEYGISLQQYWIGLIGLAGMLVVMAAGFVYLKFANPHNTDQKDR